MTPIFSIILPVYFKYGDLNYQAIESVLKQNKNPVYELLLVLHETDKIIDLSLYENFSFIRLIYVNISNLVEKRNAGIANSRGKYIIFLDCDDMLNSEFLYNSYDILKKYMNIDLIVFQHTRSEKVLGETNYDTSQYYENKELLSVIYAKYKSNQKSIFLIDSVWGKVFNAEIIKSNNITFTLTRGEDYLFVSQYLLKTKSLVYNNYVGYFWRINKGSLMTNTFWFETTFLFIENLARILQQTNAITTTESYRYFSKFIWEIGEYISSIKLSNKEKVLLLQKLVPKNSVFMKSIILNRFSYSSCFWNLIAILFSHNLYTATITLLNIRKFLKNTLFRF